MEQSISESSIAAKPVAESQAEIAARRALEDFSMGLDGERPEAWVVMMATRITDAAITKTIEPEVTVDVDGALSFDLRLTDGCLMLAELELSGSLDASVYARCKCIRSSRSERRPSKASN